MAVISSESQSAAIVCSPPVASPPINVRRDVKYGVRLAARYRLIYPRKPCDEVLAALLQAPVTATVRQPSESDRLSKKNSVALFYFNHFVFDDRGVLLLQFSSMLLYVHRDHINPFTAPSRKIARAEKWVMRTHIHMAANRKVSSPK